MILEGGRLMKSTKGWLLILGVLLVALLAFSCAKKEKKGQAVPADTTKGKELSYISEEINFGVYFDEGGTKRTIKLEKGQKTLPVHVVVHFPEGMGIAAVEYRLVLPQGLAIETDKAYPKIIAHLGNFIQGISETFECTQGPSLLLHTFELKVTGELSNAEIAIMSDPQNNFLGVALCKEGQEMIPASSYKAVVNPTE
jgi:hypothetical protein